MSHYGVQVCLPDRALSDFDESHDIVVMRGLLGLHAARTAVFVLARKLLPFFEVTKQMRSPRKHAHVHARPQGPV